MRARLAVLALAAASAAGLAYAPRASAQTTMDLQGERADLAVRLTAASAGQPEASGQAVLTGNLDTLQTRLQLGLKTGPQTESGPDAGWWNSTEAKAGAVWTPWSIARIELGAQDMTRMQFSATDPIYTDGARHYAESRQSGVDAAATLTPVSPVDLKVAASVSTQLQHSLDITGSGAQTGDLVQNDARRLSATLSWKPWSAVRLEAGGRMESDALAWSAGRVATQPQIDPSASLSINPWTGASWRLSLDRTATPLTAEQFIGYAGDTVSMAAAAPNREWRYGAAFAQKAGPLDLSASVLQAHVQSYAYLAAMGPYAARVGFGEGDRSEVSAGLAAPLPLPWLAPFTLKATGVWRASTVQDPLTGVIGRLSGERPYDASLTLSQSFGAFMRWGMTAKASGAQRTFGASEIASLSSSAGLGGFLQYRTRPVTLQLTLDNILGGERDERDMFFAGARDLNVVDHLDQSRVIDRAVHISLIRPL
jgi:hypothetical protein